MEAPSSGSGGPGSGGLSLASRRLGRNFELALAARAALVESFEFQEIMTELVTEATEYQITSAAWLEHIETHTFTTDLRTGIDNFIAEVTQTVSRIEDIKADPKKDLAMHLIEEDLAFMDH